MLLFVSDLHLSDRLETSPADVPALLSALEAALARAFGRGVERARLVLLGDIFELLKSERWLETTARPWLPPSPQGAAVVSDIFAAICREHQAFFTGLTALTQQFHGLELEYLPGNHDAELNTPLGAGARAELRRRLPLAGVWDDPFPTVLLDPEHEVLAKHGHEWDPLNRSVPPFAAVGDVVVIEIVARLPWSVRRQLGESVASELEFLDELDNVRPQHPRVMAEWLLHGLAGMGDHEPQGRAAVGEALETCLEAFAGALGEARFEATETNPWLEGITALVAGLMSPARLWSLAARLPRPKLRHLSESGQAQIDLDQVELSLPCRYCISGHTHRAETVHLPGRVEAAARHRLYVNTGTWRRVFATVEAGSAEEPPSFSSFREECLVEIFSPKERARGLPAFRVENRLWGEGDGG